MSQELPERFSANQQRNFVAGATVNVGEIITDPKGTMWDADRNYQGPKADLARKAVACVAAQITGGLVLAILASKNAMLDKLL